MIYQNLIKYPKPYNSSTFFRLNYIFRSTCNLSKFPGGKGTVFDTFKSNDYVMIFPTTNIKDNFITVKNGNNIYELFDGNMVIYRPNGNKQEIIMHDDSSYIIAIFSGTGVPEILNRLNIHEETVYKPMFSYAILQHNRSFEFVCMEFERKHSYSSVVSSAMFIEALGVYSRNAIHSQQDSSNDIVLNAIRELNILGDIDIDKIIKDSHLSKSRFYYIFKKATGMSILQYVNNNRLSIAADYLIIYNYSVKEAAAVVYFKDPLYFSRAFKKKFGMSPQEYKKLHKDHNYIGDTLYFENK